MPLKLHVIEGGRSLCGRDFGRYRNGVATWEATCRSCQRVARARMKVTLREEMPLPEREGKSWVQRVLSWIRLREQPQITQNIRD